MFLRWVIGNVGDTKVKATIFDDFGRLLLSDANDDALYLLASVCDVLGDVSRSVRPGGCIHNSPQLAS
jgi:hypothetical protein